MSTTEIQPRQRLRLRRAAERGFEDMGWTDNWFTFCFKEYNDPAWRHFGPLRVMIENHIQPHTGFGPHSHRDVEIVTYIAAGALTHGDNFGHSAAVTAGEMQHISAGEGMIHSEENLGDVVEHNYQIWFIPERTGTEFAYHQLGFPAAERLGRLRLYVSPDGADGSMPINTDARIYAGLFNDGDRFVHRREAGRGVWLQMVHGRANVADLTLGPGDGVGIDDGDTTDGETLEIHIHAPSEILLFDVRMDAPLIWT